MSSPDPAPQNYQSRQRRRTRAASQRARRELHAQAQRAAGTRRNQTASRRARREQEREHRDQRTKGSRHTTKPDCIPKGQERTRKRTSCPSTKARIHTTKRNCFPKGQESTTERTAQRTTQHVHHPTSTITREHELSRTLKKSSHASRYNKKG